MKIYKAEERAGLTDKIVAAKIKLTAKVSPSLKKVLSDLPKAQNLKASLLDWNDLFPVESILATTTVNLNDTLFTKEDVYAARNTPVDKPFNIEHDEFDIIGHIVSSKVVDDELKEIPEDTATEDLPDKFHVLINSVLYKHWADEDRQGEIDEILAEIADDKWCVSMELLQNEFDYAIEKEESVYQIISRSEDTAFLTKHLRIFGGAGTYQNKKLCIVPRNFIFSGVGLVESPANPESVITNHGSVKIQAGVHPMDENKMAEFEQLKKDHEALKASVTKAEVDRLVATKESTEKDLVAAKAEINTLSANKTELEGEVAGLKSKLATVETEKSGLVETNTALITEVANYKAESVKAARTNDLLGVGVDAVKAAELAPIYAKLSDDDFKAILPTLTVKAEEKPSKVEAAVTVVEGSEPTETPTIPNNVAAEVNDVFSDMKAFYASAVVDDRKKPRTRRTK